MKSSVLFYLTTLVVLATSTSCFSQNMNWANLQNQNKHIVQLRLGWDYGLVYELGYSHQLQTAKPVLLSTSFSFPSGSKLFDDFKVRIGAQAVIYRINQVQFSGSIRGIYRRYENPLVRLQNFGAELNGAVGYYKPTWFVAGEFGFDKAIVTHFKHSKSYRENVYSDVSDGWSASPTGGNFSYGIQAGYSIKRMDFSFRLGRILTADFKSTPLIPYYGQLGVNYLIGGSNKQ